MNRKLREGGFAARGLDDAAICQIAADDSDSFISEATVETLAVAHQEKKWRRLTDILVKVGRWEIADGGWIVHDYEEFNYTRAYWEAEKAKKRDAGQKGGQASAKARGQAGASTVGQAGGGANGQAASLRFVDPTITSSSTNARPHGGGDDDDQDSIDEALRLLAERDLADRESVPGKVGDRQQWLATAVERRRTRHATSLAGFEGLTAAEIVAILEPDSPGSADDQLATAAADGRRRAQLPPCEKCDSTGWVDGDPTKGKCTDCRRLLPAQKGRSRARAAK